MRPRGPKASMVSRGQVILTDTDSNNSSHKPKGYKGKDMNLDLIKQMRAKAYQQAPPSGQASQNDMQSILTTVAQQNGGFIDFETGKKEAELKAQQERDAAIDAAFAELQNDLEGSNSSSSPASFPAVLPPTNSSSSPPSFPAVLPPTSIAPSPQSTSVSSSVMYQQPLSSSVASSVASSQQWSPQAFSRDGQAMPSGSWKVRPVSSVPNDSSARQATHISTPQDSAKRKQEPLAYTGQIARKQHTFGFIRCDQVVKDFGTDEVWCAGNHLTPHNVGDWVEFEIRTNADKGDPRPRAINVQKAFFTLSDPEPAQKKQKVPDGTFFKF